MAKKEVASDLIPRWQKLVESNNKKQLVAYFEKMVESERREIAPLAIKQFAAQLKLSDQAFMQGLGNNKRSQVRDPNMEAMSVLATANFSELKAVSRRVWHYVNDGTALTLLQPRKPAWLAEWSEWLLEQSPWNWPVVRPCVQAGLIGAPRHRNYVLALTANMILHRYSGLDQPIAQFLKNHPDLLETIPYRLFEVEGQGEFSLGAHDKYGRGENTWSFAMRSLAKERLLDRERLLIAALDALSRDVPQFQAGWYSRFYEECEPTAEERTRHVAKYLHLLGSKIGPTVAFALKALKSAVKEADERSQAKLIKPLAAGLQSPVKSTVAASLELYESILQREPKQNKQVCLLIAGVLGHEKIDVQKLMLQFLRRHADLSQKDVREAITGQQSLLGASLKKEVGLWLGTPTNSATTASSTPTKKEWSELKKAARGIREPWRTRCGLDRLDETGEALPAALAASVLETLANHNDEPMPVVASLEECIERAAKLLETPSDAVEYECVLDGISRFCAERPAQFTAWTAALLQRVKKLQKKSDSHPFNYFDWRLNLSEVIYCWLTGEALSLKYVETIKQQGDPVELWQFSRGGQQWTMHGSLEHAPWGFVPLRLLALSQRVARRVALPMLGMPTHRQGWIDPKMLAIRLKAWEQAGEEPPVQEQVLAIMRLDRREGATASFHSLKHPLAAAARLALGEKVKIPRQGQAAVWMAALVAANPGLDINELRQQTAHLQRKEIPPEKHYSWYYDDDETDDYRKIPFDRTRSFKKLMEPWCWAAGKTVDAQDLMQLLTKTSYHEYLLENREDRDGGMGMLRWLPTAWPGGHQPLYGSLIFHLVNNLDWYEAQWNDVVLLEPLLHGDEPLEGSTLLTMMFLLGARDSGQQRLATDVLLAGIRDGRLEGDRLGVALGQVLQFPWIKATRLAKALNDAVACGPLYQLTIVKAMEISLTNRVATPPRDLHALLAAWLEWASETGSGVSLEAARGILSGMVGSSKLGKLAARLLEQPHQVGQDLLQAATLEAWRGRVERATLALRSR